MKEANSWLPLAYEDIKDTLATLHQWIQIVGKIRLQTMPWQNHSWHVALYVSAKGFSTRTIPYQEKCFKIDFDFEKHKLFIECTGEEPLNIDLRPRTVSDFYAELFQKIESIGLPIKIHGSPNELETAIPFKENTVNHSYDPKAAYAIWQAMLRANRVFNIFRSEFIGKCSPVHLFWGSFDLAVTRFSGNPAPPHQGAMPNMPTSVMQEAYSQELSSAGFWLGTDDFPTPAFYSYVYPNNPKFKEQKIAPSAAYYNEELGEFLLNYEEVQQSENPEKTLLAFLHSTYEAAAEVLEWDRASLERS